MIRSARTTMRFANSAKREALAGVQREYLRVVRLFVDYMWEQPHKEVKSLMDKTATSFIGPTTLSARLLQCAGKQASGIVRGTRKKREQRLWRHNKLAAEGKHKQARKLWMSIEKYDVSKPDVKEGLPMELDERFCQIELDVATKEFDGWLTLGSLGLPKMKVPFKRTAHFNELHAKGAIKKGVRISGRAITFMFELPDVPQRTAGTTAGIDIGMTTAFSVSQANGPQWASAPCAHGHDLASICQKITRKKKGSRGFREACQHRRNYINQQTNLMPWDGVKQINIEQIRHMRRGKTSSRYMSHFTYAELLGRLKSVSETRGVLVQEVDPAFTSQRCSCCGWTREANRKRKKFQCESCGFAADADLNASSNLSLSLPALSRSGKKRPDNKRGFYWRVESPGKEPMSPLCSETSFVS